MAPRRAWVNAMEQTPLLPASSAKFAPPPPEVPVHALIGVFQPAVCGGGGEEKTFLVVSTSLATL